MTAALFQVNDLGDGNVQIHVEFEGNAKTAALLLEQAMDECKKLWFNNTPDHPAARVGEQSTER